MKRQSTKGECEICSKSFASSGMTKHLKSCGVAKESAASVRKSVGNIFHVTVADRYSKVYWMHLAVPAEASLHKLDSFLRVTWLECCGHLSAFRINQRDYSSSPMTEYMDFADGDEQLSMDASVGSLLAVGQSFSYEYDFGSTTHLALKVVGLCHITPLLPDRIQMLARNDAIESICQRCERQPATEICTECQWDDVSWFCKACAESHECGTEMCLPVVNSPRAGVCGYTGPA